jgi:hypothetical protein
MRRSAARSAEIPAVEDDNCDCRKVSYLTDGARTICQGADQDLFASNSSPTPMRVRARHIILFIALLCALRSANAARIEVSRLDDGSPMVLLDGDIELDDIAQFWGKVATLPMATVALRSDGGSLLPGIRIGTLIRENGSGLRARPAAVPTAAPLQSVSGLAARLYWH